MTTTPRRPGLSLTEVLVTLFIMAIGAVSVLVLFPLGALNMASALKDDRTSQAALQADSFMRFYWAQNVADPLRLNPTGPDPDFSAAFSDPQSGQPVLTLANTNGGTDPSYPVFVDPMGRFDPWPVGTQTDRVANLANLPRRNLGAIDAQPLSVRPSVALRTCSLLDGMTFDPKQGGSPVNPDTGSVDREYRYNWLWVLQRPRWSDRANATMTVVVFDKRTHLFVPPQAEHAFTGVDIRPGGVVGGTSISVPATAGVVLAKGGWIMDGTVDATASPPVRAAKFYRIVSATENGTNIDLELDRRLPSQVYPSGATFVVLAGVSEVFERPNLTP